MLGLGVWDGMGWDRIRSIQVRHTLSSRYEVELEGERGKRKEEMRDWMEDYQLESRELCMYLGICITGEKPWGVKSSCIMGRWDV